MFRGINRLVSSPDSQPYRASKLKDHKIGRSPYFYETKSGDFLRELFKVLPKTIGLRNDLRTVFLRRCLFYFIIESTLINSMLSNPR